MKWLRLYHDTVLDPKWRLVALDSGQPLSAVLAVWMSMLINASDSSERGTLEGWDDRVAGAAIDLRGDAVAAIRQAMQGLVLEGLRLTGWDKRQRASDDIAARVKRHRAKETATETGRGGGGVNGAADPRDSLQAANVTLHSDPCNVTETDFPLRAQTPDSELEEERGVCVKSEFSAGAHACEAETPTASAVLFSKIVEFPPRGGRLPLPAGWVPSDEQMALARSLGLKAPEISVLKFRGYWRSKGAAKDGAGWCDAWEWWVRKDVEHQWANSGLSPASAELLAGLAAEGYQFGSGR